MTGTAEGPAKVAAGRLIIANPQYALDLNQAEASLQKVRNYGADTIICYHGGVWMQRAQYQSGRNKN